MADPSKANTSRFLILMTARSQRVDFWTRNCFLEKRVRHGALEVPYINVVCLYTGESFKISILDTAQVKLLQDEERKRENETGKTEKTTARWSWCDWLTESTNSLKPATTKDILAIDNLVAKVVGYETFGNGHSQYSHQIRAHKDSPIELGQTENEDVPKNWMQDMRKNPNSHLVHSNSHLFEFESGEKFQKTPKIRLSVWRFRPRKQIIIIT